jgi:D-glycero-D-manno-heptose 1,7-bisphosphate phosphatase
MIKQAVILAGGEGKRLKDFIEIPKPLIPFNSVPHICKLLVYLKLNGVSSVILLVRLGQRIDYEYAIGEFDGSSYLPQAISIVEEKEPQGTGGWILNNLQHLQDRFIVTNADTLYRENLFRFLAAAIEADSSMLIVNRKDSTRIDTGNVCIDSNGFVTRFEEKTFDKTVPYESSGIYIFKTADLICLECKQSNVSLERSVIPRLIRDNRLRAGILFDPPHDYGTKDRFLITQTGKLQDKPSWLFLDRDNTLTVDDAGYSHDHLLLERIKVLDPLLRGYQNSGFFLAIITNQSGIGRGLFKVSQMNEYNEKLVSLLLQDGIQINNIEFCPHIPSENCLCRKPRTGMLSNIDAFIGVNKHASIMVGDSDSDYLCASEFGISFLRFSFLRSDEDDIIKNV